MMIDPKLGKLKCIVFIFILWSINVAHAQQDSGINLNGIQHISKSNIDHNATLLKKGDLIEIKHWGMGCNMFSPLERTLIIEKTDLSFAVSLCCLSVELNEEDLFRMLRKFDEDLSKTNAFGHCTSSNKLLININANNYLGFDQSCKWQGFSELVYSIFGKWPHNQDDEMCN